MNNTRTQWQLFLIMAAEVVKSLIFAKYLRELLFVDDDAEAAAADNIDEWFKAERAELPAPGGVKGR